MTLPASRLRHAATLLLVGLCAVSLASCKLRPKDKYGRVIPTAEELDPAGALYSKAVNQANKGEGCTEETINVLTCFSWKGHGFEGAQNALGKCLVEDGRAEEGVTWMKRAGNAGSPDAQKALARLYAEGQQIPRNDLEAMTWTNLYVRNPSLLSLGVQPDMNLAMKLRSSVDLQTQAEAMRRSNNWVPTYWKPDGSLDPDIAASCKTKRGKGDRRTQMIQDNPY